MKRKIKRNHKPDKVCCTSLKSPKRESINYFMKNGGSMVLSYNTCKFQCTHVLACQSPYRLEHFFDVI